MVVARDFVVMILSVTLVLSTWLLESCTKPEQKAALTAAAAPV